MNAPTPLPVRARPRRARGALALAAGALLLPAALAAQVGAISGRVTDGGNAPVASAIVEVDANDAITGRGTTTGADGRYLLPALPAGRYRLRVRHPGYSRESRWVEVRAGQASVQNFVLTERPTVIDTVVVAANSPVNISREDTEFSTAIREEAIRLMPVNPDPKELVAQAPGARAGGQVWGGATQQANNYQIDGLAANHPGVGGDLIQPSLNWIESVEIKGLGAAAEYGNFQGGLVNIRTKSGTNRFQAAFHASGESAGLTASNLQRFDVAREMNSRFDVEGEVRGPIVKDRLFYFLAGQLVSRDERVVSHRRGDGNVFLPELVDWRERRLFGKLSWQPTARDALTVSGGYIGLEADRFGANGYENDGAYLRMDAPTTFYNAAYSHVLGAGTTLDASVAGFSRDERRTPYAGLEVPGVWQYGLAPKLTYRNAPFGYRMAPEALSAAASLSLRVRTGPAEHQLKLGTEYSAGSWASERIRSGGMTWRPPVGSGFDPADPATWRSASVGFVPAEFGGEVHLDADVANGAVYLQDHVDFGSRFSLSPGVRLGWWEGYITPGQGTGPRFRAVHHAAVDGRIGVTVDVTGRNETVLKAHAGRYHQNMFAQFYDRVEGGNVFSNEETWYYRGPLDGPGQAFTGFERDSLAQIGQMTAWETIRLNQTGPVVDYRQPYVDQLVVGVEQRIGRWWKAELVYVNRRNHDMVALVDRNAATNYTLFDGVYVAGLDGDTLGYDGASVFMKGLYLPNNVLAAWLRAEAECDFPPCQLPIPGLTVADLPSLTWAPDYVLTNVPQARRTFDQVQAVLRADYRTYGGMISAVYTQLKGNLDNVAGYEDPAGFGAGPFVNPNQAVNFYGFLDNSAEVELKIAMYGDLAWGVRGGVFWNDAKGDRYSPVFTLSGLRNRYFDEAWREIPSDLFGPVTGQPVFIGPRGAKRYANRSTVDVHLERGVRWGRSEWLVTLDGFNVFNRDAVTRYNTSVNEGLDYLPFPEPGLYPVDPAAYYRAVRERVPPRRLRIGASLRF
ncbi:MAG TPA: TonB-dependent receptor [Longimicrobium sp.]|nr:TonB-dependent receptor [Longimicrobium sp.]